MTVYGSLTFKEPLSCIVFAVIFCLTVLLKNRLIIHDEDWTAFGTHQRAAQHRM